MAITQNISPQTENGLYQMDIPYNRDFVGNAAYVQPEGTPVLWFSFECYETLSSTNGSVDDGGLLRIRWTGFAGTIAVVTGDYIWIDGADSYYEVVKVNTLTGSYSLDVTLNAPYGVISNATTIAFYNRLSRLQPFVINLPDGVTITPITRGIFVNTTTATTGGRPSVAILIDLQKPAIVGFAKIQPTYANTSGSMIDLTVSYGFKGDALSTSDIWRVVNALNVKPINSLYILSNIIGNQYYRSRWLLPDCRIVDSPVQQYKAGDYSNPDFGLFPIGTNAGYLSWLERINQVGPNPFWVVWQSRYGGYQMWCFNFDQTKTNRTKSYGDARVGYSILDLGKQANKTIKLNTGPISTDYSEWFVDMANSPVVWYSLFPWVGNDIPEYLYFNFDRTSWTVCTVEDMAFIESAANTNLVDFQPTISLRELDRTYLG